MSDRKSAQGPPTNSSKLDKILHRLIQHYHAIGQLKTPPNKTDFKKAKTELEALLQSERQSLLDELKKNLPRKQELFKQQINLTDYQKGLNFYRDQVLTIIKELGNPSGRQ